MSMHKKRKVHSMDKHHKKARFMWPSELHDEFIAAIFDLGLAHITADTILESAEAKGLATSIHQIDRYMHLMRVFRNQRRHANCCKMVARIPASKLQTDSSLSRRPSISSITSGSPRGQTGLFNEFADQPKLSAASLRPFSTGGIFQHKEFPHLKDILDHPTTHDDDLFRPFSPISSEIDSFEFDWENNAFNSAIIQMYL